VVVVLVGVGLWFVLAPWPQTSGKVAVASLSAPVQVLRDKWGVPHVYAQNEHDLFFAQGYVQAQDRLWQMEFNRRVGSGKLSAVLGPKTLDIDRFMRTFGLRRAAEKDWEELDEDSRAVLQAYAEGVNAYIESHRGRLPVEFTLLGIKPEPWTPVDSLTFGKLMTFNLGGNHRLELLRASFISKFGEDITQQLLPVYGADKPLIVPSGVQSYAGLGETYLEGLTAVDAILGEPGPVWGSNNWVVHGSRTATGQPLLANDTHLNLGMPNIWYENGLHGGRFESVGFTFAGVPGVVLGHNAHIAWGVSNLNPDVQDFYIEKLNDPEHPTQSEFKGQWEDLKTVSETIQIKKREPLTVNVLITRHGPIMNDVMSGDLKDAPPMALRWTGLEGSRLFQAIIQINLATNWDQFRQALSHWDMPGQNFVYADVEGNIGYQATGRTPIRPAGDQGLMPVIGWTGEHEWQGFVPFEEMPSVLNPPAGFIATANNKIVGDDYPYELAYDWDPGYRAQRITDLLKADDSITVEDMQTIQADTYSLPAEALAHYLLAVQPVNDLEARALKEVETWDWHYETDRSGAAVYQVWYWFLLKNTLDDDLGADAAGQYLAGNYERHGTFQLPMMIKLMAQADEPWFDDKTTSAVETRDDIVRRSLTDSVAWLSERYGNDPAQWTWGRLHTMTFVEAPLGQSGIRLLEKIFNSSATPARGDNFTVNAGSFRYGNPFVMVHGSSQRDIMDLSDLGNSLSIHATGQSGLIFHPHRSDFISLWQGVTYHPMLFTREKIDANTEAVLTLEPR